MPFSPSIRENPMHKKIYSYQVYDRIFVVLSVLLLYYIIGICYQDVIVSKFSFGGFELQPRDSSFLEWFLVFLLGVFMPPGIKSSTQMFSWISAVFLLLPATALSAYQSSSRSSLLLMYLSTLYVVFLSIFFSFCNKIKYNGVVDGRFYRIVKIVLFVYISVFIYLLVSSPGLKTFSFGNVYEYRFDFNDSLRFPLNYLLPITGNSLSAFLMAYSLAKKKYSISAFVIFLGALMFAISTHKVYLFVPVFTIVWFCLIGLKRGGLLLLSILGLASILSIVFVNSEINIFGNLFANRILFIPAQINFNFIESFSEIGYQFWAESKISFGLSKSDIPMPSVNYIAEKMTGDSAIGANTGWVANAYMNAGVFGLGIYGVLIALVLFLVEKWSKKYSQIFVLPAFSVSIFSMVNSMDFLVILLTGGLGVIMLIFYSVGYKNNNGL